MDKEQKANADMKAMIGRTLKVCVHWMQSEPAMDDAKVGMHVLVLVCKRACMCEIVLVKRWDMLLVCACTVAGHVSLISSSSQHLQTNSSFPFLVAATL